MLRRPMDSEHPSIPSYQLLARTVGRFLEWARHWWVMTRLIMCLVLLFY